MTDEPIWRRYRRLLRPDPQRDVDDEIAFHLQMRIDEFERAGRSPVEAREEAMHRFGHVDQVLEECHEIGRQRARRGSRSWRWQSLRQDVRVGLRGLSTRRGFALAVIVTMALGIGANTAMFSVAYGVLLRPLPFRDADQLVRLWSRKPSRGLEYFSVSAADFRDWRAENHVFSAMGAFERQRDATLVRQREPERIEVARVMPEVFQLLGTGAHLGRALVADDVRPGAPAVAVLAHETWLSRFGGDTAVIGADVAIDGVRSTIVGVMPPRYVLPGSLAQIWQPLAIDQASDDHSNRELRVLGRLVPGVSMAKARSELEVIADRLARAHVATNNGWTVNMMSVTENIVGPQFRRAVLVLVGVVGLVLLIACANAANLQLARATARRKEMALRTALGASRGRIVTQLLTESALLSFIAGIAGLALAYGGIAMLRKIGTTTVPRLGDVRLDAPVLVFTIVVAFFSSILFGLAPAIRASRTNVGEVLKEGGRGGETGRTSRRIRSALVVAEMTLSLVLLIGAGLLLRSFARLQAVDVGFQPGGVSVAALQLPEPSYPRDEQVSTFYDDVVERARHLPGVTDAAAVSSAPFGGPNTGLTFTRADRPIESGTTPDADDRIITPGYLRALRIPVIHGRDFSTADRAGATNVALISGAAAQRYWPGEDAVGSAIRVAGLRDGTVTIVGVVGDVRYQSLETPETRPMIYFPASQNPARSMSLIVRTENSTSLAPALRRIVSAVDPTLPPPDVTGMDALIDTAMSTRRFALVLLGIFAGTALVLAVVGIYSVMAYTVRQQTHELGVRIALGARPATLVAGVVGGALRLAITGVVLGLAGAWALTRLLSTLLFGVGATDPLTFVGVAALLTIVAVAASLFPARTATRADPVSALRAEQ
jgi:predicted permease